MELRDSCQSLQHLEDSSFLRYALMPLIVLALISLPGSKERALYNALFQQFKDAMASKKSDWIPNGGAPIDFTIDWDLLDNYSAEVDHQLRGSVAYLGSPLIDAAPEWNWRYMLQKIDLASAWPANAGTMNMELGTEFWAFNLLSKCCTQEVFATFIDPDSSKISS
ncbi:hypothetical protein ACEQ8H_000593 [Pleosporales sp. CAS-2024a]